MFCHAAYRRHIVACHQAASALRAAGKAIWNKRINVRAIIQEDQGNESPEHVAAISVCIAKMIRAHVPASYFDITHDDYCSDLDEVVESMESCTVEALAQDKELMDIEAVGMFNDWLEVLYDWADYNRVWLG